MRTIIIILMLGTAAMAAPRLLRESRQQEEQPQPYTFDYAIQDEINGIMSARVEERDNQGVIRGSYSYVRPDGILQTTSYIADENGFHVETKEEPAGGLEIPNPEGNIQVAVNLPYADPINYGFTAQEYYQLFSPSRL